MIAKALKRSLFALAITSLPMAITACHEDPQLEGSPIVLPSGGENGALQLSDCAVYRVTRSFFKTKIEKSLSLEFYLGPTICTSQSLTIEGAFAVATLCRQAFGAGGGCARGGTYRTADAIHWEKRGNASAWIAVPADE